MPSTRVGVRAGGGRPRGVGVGSAVWIVVDHGRCADGRHSRSIPRSAVRRPSAPPTPKATANTASRPTQGQPSESAAPSVPSADSTARVAPIRTGATTGSTSSGSSVSRPLNPAARPPYSVPTRPAQQVARTSVVTSSSDPAGRHVGAVEQRRAATSSNTSSTASCTASASDLPQIDRRRVDAGDAQGVERAVVGLDRERPLHEHEQAEQGRQPHQPRRHPFEHVARSRGRRRTSPSSRRRTAGPG